MATILEMVPLSQGSQKTLNFLRFDMTGQHELEAAMKNESTRRMKFNEKFQLHKDRLHCD